MNDYLMINGLYEYEQIIYDEVKLMMSENKMSNIILMIKNMIE